MLGKEETNSNKIMLEEILNQLHAMCADEQTLQHHNYFTQEVNEDCRKKMVDWCFTVVDSFTISRESVWRAMYILDRYLSSGKGLSAKALENKHTFQCASTVCLYIAVKVYEDVEMTIGFLEKLCRNYYKASEFINMEHDVLFALNWKVAALTTPLDFVRQFLLLQSDFIDPANIDQILETGQKYMDFATTDAYFTSCKQSSVGIACLGVALVESAVSPAEQEQFWLQLSSMLSFEFASKQVRNIERRMLSGSTICKPKRQSNLVLSKTASQISCNESSNEQTSPVSILSWAQCMEI